MRPMRHMFRLYLLLTPIASIANMVEVSVH